VTAKIPSSRFADGGRLSPQRPIRGPPNRHQAAGCAALTPGKLISGSATLFMKFVSRNCADSALMSMIYGSVKPAP